MPHPPTSTLKRSAIRPLPGNAPHAGAGQQVIGDGWRVTVLADGLLRIERSTDGGFEDRASTFAVRRDLPAAPFTALRTGNAVEITTTRVRLRYDGAAFTANGLIVETLGADAQTWRYGEPTRDLGGTARTLDEVDGRIELEPGVVAPDGIAIVDDSASFLFEDDGWIGIRAADREDLYIFGYGRDYQETIQAFYAVSGDPMLLPRWALGNWWSRYHRYSSESYLALMDRFRAERLPFSVAVIDMDWHRVDSVPPEHGTGWTGYSWEPTLFPDPAAFLAELHRRGMRTTLNLHPATGVRAFEDRYPEMARAVGVDSSTGEAVPFNASDRVFLEAYFRELHHPLERQGVDFWWIDWQQGRTSNQAGVDPLWVLNHFHHLDAARDGGSGMTFSRYAGPGSHRYAVGFSGDAVISWASLAFQPEFTATAANIGYCWWSHDIGGHTTGIRDDELATRWVQFGVFSPIMRLHSANNPFIRKEPWAFPPAHRAAMDDALRLRHRMVPYLHTMNHRAAEQGIPLVRPIYHAEPRRREAYTVPHEYEFGSELILAPITEPASTVSLRGRVRAWLPAGLWTDIFTGTVYRGNRAVELHRTIASIPALLRAGGILPLDASGELDATVNPAELDVLVAPAASGHFVLVEDRTDDQPPATALGDVARTPLSWDRECSEFRIGAVAGATDVVPQQRTWTITMLAALPYGAVTVEAEPTDAVTSTAIAPEPLAVTGEAGRWSITVQVRSDAGAVVRFGTAPLRVGGDPIEKARVLLETAQMGNPEKLAAWEILSTGRSPLEQLTELGAADLPEPVRSALAELLGAVSLDDAV